MLGDDRPPAALAEYTGFLMNWVAARSRLQFARVLAESSGLHPREFGVLVMIARSPGISQHAIGEGAGVDPSTMVAILDALEERGLAERRPHPGDRRKRAIYLTDEGKYVLAKAQKAAAVVGKQVFAPLSQDERRQLHELLVKLTGLNEEHPVP
jgi:DNA-binding MarR family transcriptional regulator